MQDEYPGVPSDAFHSLLFCGLSYASELPPWSQLHSRRVAQVECIAPSKFHLHVHPGGHGRALPFANRREVEVLQILQIGPSMKQTSLFMLSTIYPLLNFNEYTKQHN